MGQRWTDGGTPPINPTGTARVELPDAASRLRDLRARAHADLHALRHPETPWLPPRTGPNGREMRDVVIVGAGQGGLAVGGVLMREQVQNILLIDRAPRDHEGVWHDFARTPVIRSPKHYPGPDMGIPNLTYEAWHRARFGDADWDGVTLVTIDRWVEYLSWVRDTLDLPVRNRTELVQIAPVENGPVEEGLPAKGLALTLHNLDADTYEEIFTRRLVLATGHDGTGSWWMPPFIAALPVHLRAHAAQHIDFDALAGRRVAVLGVGASGGDNAICALESGARAVHMYCRRDTHRRQQVYRWCINAGFLRHFQDLDDAWRWRFMHYILNIRMGMPPETWKRVSSFDAFKLHTDANWRAVQAVNDTVVIELENGEHHEVDYVIAATGHDQDLSNRPELAPLADLIAKWADKYVPPDELRDDRLARYPYLGPGFEFLERKPGAAPFVSRIHDFTFGPTMSFGPSGCSISTLRLSAPMLAAGVTRSLFQEDAERQWQALLDHPDMIP